MSFFRSYNTHLLLRYPPPALPFSPLSLPSLPRLHSPPSFPSHSAFPSFLFPSQPPFSNILFPFSLPFSPLSDPLPSLYYFPSFPALSWYFNFPHYPSNLSFPTTPSTPITSITCKTHTIPTSPTIYYFLILPYLYHPHYLISATPTIPTTTVFTYRSCTVGCAEALV